MGVWAASNWVRMRRVEGFCERRAEPFRPINDALSNSDCIF
jgi:hypothetical protein